MFLEFLALPKLKAQEFAEEKRPKAQEFAELLRSLPYMKYDASSCRFLLMPLASVGNYVLFVFDREEKRLTVLDTIPVPDWCQDMPYKLYVQKILKISKCYGLATKVQSPGCGVDIFQWKHILPSAIPITEDGSLSGFITLQFMSAWNNGQLMPICMDGQTLRKNFVINLLAYDGNSRRCLIPAFIREYLSRITGKKNIEEIFVVNLSIMHLFWNCY